MARVAPLAGARIEMSCSTSKGLTMNSVAPLAGARIEIYKMSNIHFGVNVAPLAGARIEIQACIPKRQPA